MHENIDASLASLAAEINELEAARKTGNREKMVEIGWKIRAARELLLARNGERSNSPIGADGKKAPNGYGKWILEHIGISISHAVACVRSTYPELHEATRQQRSERKYQLRTPEGCNTRIKKLWPKYTDAEKADIATFIRERALEERTNVVG